MSQSPPQAYYQYSKPKPEVTEIEDEEPEIGRIRTAGDNGEFVIIGRQKYYKHELMRACAGTFNPGLSPPPTHNFGNATAVGVFAFIYVTYLVCIINIQARHTTINNVVFGSGFFYGGLVQFLAGIWEIAMGNAFGGTCLSSFGAYWLSYSSINTPGFGIITAYEDKDEFNNALGLFYVAWCIFSAMMLPMVFKATFPFFVIVLTLVFDYLFSAISLFTGSLICQQVASAFGLALSLAGLYAGIQGVYNRTNSYFTLPELMLPTSD